jgi:hypothetical protein
MNQTNQGQLRFIKLSTMKGPDTLGQERNLPLGELKRWRSARHSIFRYQSACSELCDGGISPSPSLRLFS